MKKVALFLIIFSLFNCNKVDKQIKIIIDKDSITTGNIKKIDFPDKKLHEDLDKAILEGDTLLYQKCYKKYVTNGHDKEFLYYAILMAEKNNYKKAYFDISRILALRTDNPLSVKYKYSSTLGTYSFLKAYEMGDEGAKEGVKYMYIEENKPIPKSSSIYCNK
ncbi:hypothetical protein [Chryseobacterium sp. ERMR1:04]|uniref:hypothetical protein n=1 Tax=Chryseobacterium sp. ERMR1:04 TaxID=1705393 RepID=UPI0006C86A6B|nr:hypothetical protein [Chryseobacterium sp. ERMR1:04]KPH13824.1 hypothetical protein AMQ68_09825 [Chryseobacterium sp. ERMR1:04]